MEARQPAGRRPDGPVAAIEADVRALLEDLGEPPQSRLHVSLEDPLIAIVRDLRLTEAERELIRRGRPELVWKARRQFSEATCERVRGIIERATGRRLRSSSSDLHLDADQPWSAETFVLEDPGATAPAPASATAAAPPPPL